jgi:hypothetical protein
MSDTPALATLKYREIRPACSYRPWDAVPQHPHDVSGEHREPRNDRQAESEHPRAAQQERYE